MQSTKLIWTLGLAVALWTSACRQESPGTSAVSTNAPAPSGPKTFLVNGVLRKIDADQATASIQHEEIPGYMAAMTMPLTVKNTNELTGLVVGDPVVFRLTVTDTDSWIDKLKKAPGPTLNAPLQRESVRVARTVDELKEGDLIPDYRFTNELDQAISLGQFKGQAVALTFIFTRCPLPNFCPLMSKNFLETSKLLTSNPEAPTNWHLLTISFDPHHDTPAVLKAYAERYEYDPKKWSFVSGAMIDIDAITDQFNLVIAVQNDQWDHKLRTAVIDAQGRVQKILVGNLWKPEELVAEISKAASMTAAPEEEKALKSGG